MSLESNDSPFHLLFSGDEQIGRAFCERCFCHRSWHVPGRDQVLECRACPSVCGLESWTFPELVRRLQGVRD